LKCKQKLVTVLRDVVVIKIAFDVWMTLSQVYPFLNTHYLVVIQLLRVLLSIYVRKITRQIRFCSS